MFIVIETFPSPESACIVMEEESGVNKVFKTKKEADAEANACQEGIVIEL